MEVNRKIGRSFWLENLVEKCAYGARNPDWLYSDTSANEWPC